VTSYYVELGSVPEQVVLAKNRLYDDDAEIYFIFPLDYGLKLVQSCPQFFSCLFLSICIKMFDLKKKGYCFKEDCACLLQSLVKSC